MNIRRLLAAITTGATGLVLSMSVVVADDDSASFDEWVSNGVPLLNVRYRYEFVDEETFVNDAKASTIRTRVGYKTGKWSGWQVLVELEDTHAIHETDYNGLGPNPPNKPTFPVVADPLFSQLNRVWVAWGDPKRFLVKGGRMRVKLDNDRFVGNVGWRQNEQTFDALTVQGVAGENFDLFFSYFLDQNNVLGTSNGMDTPILNARWNTSYGHLVGYGYLLDYSNSALLDSQTWGLRWVGKWQFGREKQNRFDYTIELANQSDYADSSNFSADYSHLKGVFNFSGFFAGLGYEVLGSDNGNASLQTPLATLHAFNGWADRFLVNPADGLNDSYFTLGYGKGMWKLWGVWHDFDRDHGSGSYGNEFDIALTIKPWKRWTFGTKYADYNSDALFPIPGVLSSRGAKKWWLWAGFAL
ncbi:MAG: hypothetical protein E2O56_04535 [Gammaproteobacteria bacterium]|nr:MAG: hypothetical protein E2O56_04535 [Gammaproteobacteria bacterium]